MRCVGWVQCHAHLTSLLSRCVRQHGVRMPVSATASAVASRRSVLNQSVLLAAHRLWERRCGVGNRKAGTRGKGACTRCVNRVTTSLNSTPRPKRSWIAIVRGTRPNDRTKAVSVPTVHPLRRIPTAPSCPLCQPWSMPTAGCVRGMAGRLFVGSIGMAR